MYATKNRTAPLAFVGMALIIQACVSSGRLPAADRASAKRSAFDTMGAPHRITLGELRKVEGFTALDAVRRLRPEFLQSTEAPAALSRTGPSVYENGHYSGGIEQLAEIPLGLVVDVQRLSFVEAKNLFGVTCRCEGGVISVRTKP